MLRSFSHSVALFNSQKPRIRFTSQILVALSLSTLLIACFEETDDNYKLESSVKYVAMGNSLTAGFQDGGLLADKQNASYPAQLAKAMGITDFSQPLIASPGIGSTPDANKNPQGPLKLDFVTGSVGFAKISGNPADLALYATRPGPYNNLGVPGATAKDVFTALGGENSQSPKNSYFDLIIRGYSLLVNATMLDQAIAQQPEIITLEIGNNDILGGVLDGTINVNPDSGKVTVTPAPLYRSYMDSIVTALLAKTSAKIFIGNIPSISTIPYVTTIPPVVLDANFQVVVSEGKQIPLVTTEKSVQYVLFPALSEIVGKQVGIPAFLPPGKGVPLPASLTLTTTEVAIADGLVTEYNAIIDSICNANKERVVLVDVNGLLKKLTEDKIVGLSKEHPILTLLKSKGAIATAKPAFSLDGVHPSSDGYKEIAKIFLNAINTKLNTKYEL